MGQIRVKLNEGNINEALSKTDLNLTQLLNILIIEYNKNPNLRKKLKNKSINKSPSKDGGMA